MNQAAPLSKQFARARTHSHKGPSWHWTWDLP